MEENRAMGVELIRESHVVFDNRIVAVVLAFILLACLVAAYLWLRRSNRRSR
jgi:hypothetical protein